MKRIYGSHLTFLVEQIIQKGGEFTIKEMAYTISPGELDAREQLNLEKRIRRALRELELHGIVHRDVIINNVKIPTYSFQLKQS